jgi:drug/metabolite transporter (DMT)-like permease
MRAPSGSVGTLRADLALLSVAFIWGATFTLVKEALEVGPPWLFLGVRFLVSAVVFLPWIRRSGPWPWRSGALVGFFLAAGYVTQTLGLRTIEPGRSAFLTGLSVVLVPLVGGLLRWDRLGRWDLVGAASAFLGLAFLTGWIRRPGAAPGVGDLWTLACALAFALHILWVGRASRRHRAIPLAGAQIVTAAVLLWVGTGIFEPETLRGGPRLLAEIPAVFWGAALFTGLFATALAFLLQVRLQRETTATHTAIIFSMEPVFAALVGFLVRGERPGWEELVGAGLIVAGILVIQLGRPRSESPGVPLPEARGGAP